MFSGVYCSAVLGVEGLGCVCRVGRLVDLEVVVEEGNEFLLGVLSVSSDRLVFLASFLIEIV